MRDPGVEIVALIYLPEKFPRLSSFQTKDAIELKSRKQILIYKGVNF